MRKPDDMTQYCMKHLASIIRQQSAGFTHLDTPATMFVFELNANFNMLINTVLP